MSPHARTMTSESHVLAPALNRVSPVIEHAEDVHLYDRDGRRHLDAGGGAVVRGALAGSGGDAVVVAPPFTVEQEHIDMIGWALDAALGAVESRLRGQA